MLLEESRRRHVGGEHTFLDDLVGVVALDRNDSLDFATGVEYDPGFRGFKIDGTTLSPGFAQQFVEVVEVASIEDRVHARHQHEANIERLLHQYEVELVILSGYMRLLSEQFINNWAGKIVNIHPSLLPEFPGAHAHRDAIAAGVSKSGCTVHFVDAGMDTGEIIAQCEVEVLEDDTESSLANRIKSFEHILYPLVIDAIVTGDHSSLKFD